MASKQRAEVERLREELSRQELDAEKRSEQLRALAAELIQVEQQERKRIAGILHDHFQQMLVLAKIRLGQLQREITSPGGVAKLEAASEVLDELVEASRTLTVELSPPVLYEAGLAAAFEWLANDMRSKHDLDVDLRLHEGAEPASEATRVFLFQVVTELLFNTIKHSGVSKAVLEMKRSDDVQMMVRVSDLGCGFDVDSVVGKPALEGGFGLSRIQQRIDVLGGDFVIESTLGEGSRFTLMAPLEASDERLDDTIVLDDGSKLYVDTETGSASLASPDHEPHLTILLVDDHQMFREGLASLLEEETDFHVVGHAPNGRVAVELARSLRPDIILMDIDMPIMSGIEATRRICDEKLPSLVLGLTMHHDEFAKSRMLQCGAADCLEKGSASDELVARIRSLGSPSTPDA